MNLKGQISPKTLGIIVLLIIFVLILNQTKENVTVSVIAKDQNIFVGDLRVTFLYNIENTGNNFIPNATLKIFLPNNAAIMIGQEISPIPRNTGRRGPVTVDSTYWKEGDYDLKYEFAYTENNQLKTKEGTVRISVYPKKQ